MRTPLFYLVGALILITAFLTLLVFGDDDIPKPSENPSSWVEAMHSEHWVNFMISEVVNRQIKGDKAVLEEVSRCLPGTDAFGRAAWVFMVRFHRKGSATETAMITLVPVPTKIEVVIFTETNL